MAGIPQEKAVEVVDAATILDRLELHPTAELLPPVESNGDPLEVNFDNRRMGSLATAELSGGSVAQLRGIIDIPQAASLYGIVRVTRPGVSTGRHLSVVQFGAYNGDPAQGVSMIRSDVDFTVIRPEDRGVVRLGAADKGKVWFDYGNPTRGSVDIYAKPAEPQTPDLDIPQAMWLPDENTDRFMQWMVATVPPANLV